ncbi:MAG: hypothetical protein RI988_715 [Pseudomonadota bacterium]|jgi:hypothetical protein
MSNKSLLTETLEMIDQRGPDLSLREIAEGAGVGHEWLRKLVYSPPSDVGVRRVEAVFRFMSDYQAARRLAARGIRTPNQEKAP